MKKIISYTILGFLSLYGLIVILAIVFENNIQSRYWGDYNNFRVEKGIIPLTKSNDTIIENWSNFLPQNQYTKWKWILTNEEIATLSIFKYDSSKTTPFHLSKTVYYGTHLLFWKNFYGGEIDIFINPISPDTTIELTVAYHSSNLNLGNYFYTQIDTTYSNSPEIFVCGTHDIDVENVKVNTGNISKKEADQILVEWKIKTVWQ